MLVVLDVPETWVLPIPSLLLRNNNMLLIWSKLFVLVNWMFLMTCVYLLSLLCDEIESGG